MRNKITRPIIFNPRVAATLRIYPRNIVCCRYITVNTLHGDYIIIIVVVILTYYYVDNFTRM